MSGEEEMKPTQEQVITWAREAEFLPEEIQNGLDLFMRFATLAYEAGRRDENEACAKVCDEKERANLYGVRECAAAIRARREQ